MLVILGILLVNGTAIVHEKVSTRKETFDDNDMENILKATTGKSKQEALRIIRQYRK